MNDELRAILSELVDDNGIWFVDPDTMECRYCGGNTRSNPEKYEKYGRHSGYASIEHYPKCIVTLIDQQLQIDQPAPTVQEVRP